ncbi:Proteasome-activating nucleotidase [Ignisphaera aggregans DSM 17230]|uniref:Proteasome-activating nucleotidase n=1 Tax=Ignisphaera aggregans (strain DSM 17230 / JCM 13409 / AQ1.S1) TaxID=583356 RepID=E0SPT1_IGNAA|nr:Proteasome-activating nucleotidase [Ignisphaera aggregans DSM 17230]
MASRMALEDSGFIKDVSNINYEKNLENRVRELEIELSMLKEIIAKYREELEYYKSQVEKLMAPPLIEATVIEVLDDERALVKSSSGPTLIVRILETIDKSKLKPGTSVALNQRGSTIVEILPRSEDPYVQAFEVIEKPNISYDDIGGLEQQIQELREAIELPLKNPHIFKILGIEPPKGVLLYGPPGCGKTLLAKAIAHETNATFIRLVASELAQKFIGEGARIVREVFELARKKAPSIILIDEIDAIAARRIDVGTSGEREIHRTLTQLLAEMDGFNPLDNVKIIATTNRLDILDPAILRPGRFDKIIEIPLPNTRGRYEILKIHTRKMPLAEDVDLVKIAQITEGATGADLKAICVEAALKALRENRFIVSMEDFNYAIKKVIKNRYRPYAQILSNNITAVMMYQ